MVLRAVAKRFGREVHCNRALLVSMPMRHVSMQQAIGSLAVESERRAAMIWLTRGGPFWEDVRQHGEDDWLEYDGEIVTDTAVGEAAFRSMHSVHSGLTSFSPSDWNFTPVDVTWRGTAEWFSDRVTSLENWWSAAALEEALRNRELPIGSWERLRDVSTSRFDRLTFSEDCFAPLTGVPFARSAADRFLVLLDVLDRFSRAFDEFGARTEEGHQIYQDHFTGDRALFSDSSDAEKRAFRDELTFVHPVDSASSLFCTWHGKISHLTLRLHFSWPVKAEEPVYVVYAGPKITKQ